MNAHFFDTEQLSRNQINEAKKHMVNCKFIEHASGLINGDMDVYGCDNLVEIPEVIHTVTGFVNLMYCKALTKLPENLKTSVVYLLGSGVKSIPSSAQIDLVVWNYLERPTRIISKQPIYDF